MILDGWLTKSLYVRHNESTTAFPRPRGPLSSTWQEIAFSLRLLLYSALTNPWHSLAVESLNGVTFGIFYAAMTSYAHIIAPQGYGGCS